MQPCQSTMQRCLQGRNPTSCCKSAKLEAPAALTATQRALHARRTSSKQSRVGLYEGLQQIAHMPAPAPTTSPQRREYASAAQKVASDTSVASRRAVLTAGVSMLMAGSAAPSYAANDALLRRLQQKQNEDAGAEIAGPSAARAGRILAALQQISKVERMVQLEQFSGARLQLREGSASSLRKDLRDVQEFNSQITDKMVETAMGELQALDGALRVKNTEVCLRHLSALETSLREIESAAAKRQN